MSIRGGLGGGSYRAFIECGVVWCGVGEGLGLRKGEHGRSEIGKVLDCEKLRLHVVAFIVMSIVRTGERYVGNDYGGR